MSVEAKNQYKFYSASDDVLTQGRRLGDCGPIAVRSVYRFFGVNRRLTYKDFIGAGFYKYGIRGVQASEGKEFLTNKNLGLIIKTSNVSGKAEFMKKIKSARMSNHPVIMMQPGHYYTIIPHTIIVDSELGRCIRFYLSKKQPGVRVKLNGSIKRFKNLAVCFNSRFINRFGEKEATRVIGMPDVELVELDNIWREFEKKGIMNFYETKGVKFDLEKLKTPRYEWSETKKEHKKNILDAYSLYSDCYKGYVGRGFFWAKCDSFYENNPADRYDYRAKAIEFYSEAEEQLKNLNTKSFVAAFGLGEKLRKEFNKNLPALIGERRIIEYVKH